ncbi:hypothetical protein AOA80_02765 [Methanomassiliicoccales archaeon RumEn M1]|jgi:NADH:ubiquinone oxidoreductase subunit 6 (subunit J)|nr:hypothetical protein AOA80_02765 [Methanomassiliicoccales archaeon RumEn M1]
MNKRKVAIGVTALLFFAVVLGSVLMTQWPAGELADTDNAELGITLFETYGIAVLMVGFVLFVALLGGVFIAQEEER